MKTKTQQHLKLGIIISCLMTSLTACSGQQTAPIMAKPSAPITNEELTSKNWQLVSVAQSGKSTRTTLNAGPAANRYKFAFKDGRLAISGGCNNISGSYALSPNNRIAFGPMMSTKKACIESLMHADNEILSYISGITDYSINGRALTLTTAFKQRLVLKGTATPETQYGSQGVRKFIEINNTDQGLQWREAKYNSNWIRIQDNAPWETIYPGIEGFVPRNNYHYIVRINEYSDPQTLQKVWVKDMVTTTGIIR